MTQKEWQSSSSKETLHNLIKIADTDYLSTVSEETFAQLLHRELHSLVLEKERERTELQNYVDSHSHELYCFLRQLRDEKASDQEQASHKAMAVD